MVAEQTLRSYATTKVTIEKTEAELKMLLRKRGADGVQTTEMRHPRTSGSRLFVIVFVWDDDRLGVRLSVGYPESPPQAGRSALRAMYWLIKRRLDGIDYGVESFEEAFMPYLIGANGQTAKESPALMRQLIPGGFSFGPEGGDIAALQLPAETAEYRELPPE